MKVEIWSDVVCPWCYLGKRRFEHAWPDFRSATTSRSSGEASSSTPPRRRSGSCSGAEHLADKYGMPLEEARASQRRLTDLAAAEGLEYHLDRTAGGNSFDAHRLLHFAAASGRQDELKERLLRGYFTEGEAIGRRDVLATDSPATSGSTPAEVADVLAGDHYSEAVRADEQRARLLGINGVPFFAVDERYGISGAQSSDLILSALEQAWSERRPDDADPAP